MSRSNDSLTSESRCPSNPETTPKDTRGNFLYDESSSEENHAIAKELGITHLEDIFIERFQVHGRRLQKLLENESEFKGVSQADVFFEDVMKKTETYIIWPKRITDESSKGIDPYVHIYGRNDDVSWAKGLVLSKLNTKDKRLKLRIIIPNNDHRFIVGRDNNNLTRIMESTDTIVELPYSNQRNMAQKGNQVTIEGSLERIERARMQLRLSMPLLMSFEMSSNKPEPCVDLVKDKFNIQVILTDQKNTTLVFVKGSLKRIEIVKDAIRELINSTFSKQDPRPLVSVQMEIPPLYQELIKGEDNAKLLDIMEESKTKIFFPDLSINGNTKQRSQVTIIGNIDDVCEARQELLNNFPVELIFDVPGCYQTTATDIFNIGSQYGVYITISRKEHACGFTITIKGIEKYIEMIYEVYQHIISLRSSIPDTGDVPKAFYLLESAYQRVMGELVQKYMESVAQRANFAAEQYNGMLNADVNYSYIQATQASMDLQQFCSSQINENPVQGQAIYSPDSGHDSDAAFQTEIQQNVQGQITFSPVLGYGNEQPVFQTEIQPIDWSMYGGEPTDGFAKQCSEPSAEMPEPETMCHAFDPEIVNKHLPFADMESQRNYDIIYTGSAAPGAERNVFVNIRTDTSPGQYSE